MNRVKIIIKCNPLIHLSEWSKMGFSFGPAQALSILATQRSTFVQPEKWQIAIKTVPTLYLDEKKRRKIGNVLHMAYSLWLSQSLCSTISVTDSNNCSAVCECVFLFFFLSFAFRYNSCNFINVLLRLKTAFRQIAREKGDEEEAEVKSSSTLLPSAVVKLVFEKKNK